MDRQALTSISPFKGSFMFCSLRVFASAMLFVFMMSLGQFALAQFGETPSDDSADAVPATEAPAVAEKPALCQGVWAVPESAVTEGSFTAWTEPRNPRPGEKYTIIVQVKGLKGLEKFPICDLSGTVTGTDGYKDYFGGPSQEGFMPIKDQTVRLPVLTVPGAAQLVKDVIHINSKLLNEKQQLEIRFLPPSGKP